MEVDELGVEGRFTEHGHKAKVTGLERLGAANAHEVRERRSVVDTGEGRDGRDPVALAALEQVGKFGFRCAGPFFCRAFLEELSEHTGGRCPEGVADQMDLRVVARSPDVFQNAGVGPPVTGMAVLLRMVLAVVDGTADQVVVELTGSVPQVVDGSDCRAPALETVLTQVTDSVLAGTKAPAGEEAADAVFVAVAHESVDQDDRIVVVPFHSRYTPFHFKIVAIFIIRIQMSKRKGENTGQLCYNNR